MGSEARPSEAQTGPTESGSAQASSWGQATNDWHGNWSGAWQNGAWNGYWGSYSGYWRPCQWQWGSEDSRDDRHKTGSGPELQVNLRPADRSRSHRAETAEKKRPGGLPPRPQVMIKLRRRPTRGLPTNGERLWTKKAEAHLEDSRRLGKITFLSLTGVQL